jgi:hypothetical protein
MNRLTPEHVIGAPTGIPVVHDQPVKTSGEPVVAESLLYEQAQQVLACLVPIQYTGSRGTCMDERGRSRLRNGQPAEVRPSAPGGPNIYALGVAELIGLFDNQTELSGEERLHDVGERLERAGLRAGGHDDCKANAALNAWMTIIADQGETLKATVKERLGDSYSESAADYVIGTSRTVVESGVYAGWQEHILSDVLGDEAPEAIEVTDAVPHEGVTFVRNKIDNSTIDQTRLYSMSRVGKGSFDVDDAYLDDIEHILTSGPDAAVKKSQAEHAREFIIASLIIALPNPELYQIDIMAA